MPANTLPADVQEALTMGAATVGDPGNAGTISYTLKGDAHLPLTVGASNETRVLETLTLSNYPVGQTLTVYIQTTTGGTVGITGSADGTVTLNAAGDFVRYQVVPTSATAKAWRIVASSAFGSARGFEYVTKSSRDDTVTLTSGNLLSRWIEGTPTADANYTLPLVSALVANAQFAGARAGDSFTFVVNNAATGNFKIRLVTNTGWTLVGEPFIEQGQSRTFRVVLTSTSAATLLSTAPFRDVVTSTAPSGAATFSAAQMLNGAVDFAGTTYTETLPTGASMVAAIPNAKVGDSVLVSLYNGASGTITIGNPGDGSVAIKGTATIATLTGRLLRIVLTNVTAASETYSAYLV